MPESRIMRLAPAALLAALLVPTAPALSQPAAGTGRSLTSTGQTKPPGNPAAAGGPAAGAPMKPAERDAMLKAQRAAAERDKAWDAKMRSTIGSICRGC